VQSPVIHVHHTYIEGYREIEAPGRRDTGPIVIPVPQSPARPVIEKTYVVLPPPQQEQHHEPIRSPNRDQEEVRTRDKPVETQSPPSANRIPEVIPSGRSEVPPVSALPEVEPNRKKNLPPSEEKSSGIAQPEEKASELPEVKKPEDTTSGSGNTKKLTVYDGKGGRIHTEKQIEEILDWYLQTGQLPDYVSDRQKYSYRHHRSLLERRHFLESKGIALVVHEISR
jgi:hypothetical protein